MNANVNHHVGMRTADLGRSMRFYQEVFGARVLALPFPIEGDFAAIVADGPPGVHWRVAILKIGDSCIELFEFDEPRYPMDPAHMTKANLLHFTVQVDDVRATVEALERAGGRRLWPEVVDLAEGVQVIYVADPDENVIELINITMEEVAKLMIHIHPEADPSRA